MASLDAGTILWIVLYFVLVLAFYLLFRFGLKDYLIQQKNAVHALDSEAENQISIEPGGSRFEGENPGFADGEKLDPLTKSRLSVPEMHQYHYNDVFENCVYIVSVDQNVLRAVHVQSETSAQREILTVQGFFERTLFTARTFTTWKVVPLIHMTTVQFNARSHFSPLIAIIAVFMNFRPGRYWNLLASKLLFASWLLLSVAYAICFYVPFTMDYDFENGKGADHAVRITRAYFSCYVLAAILFVAFVTLRVAKVPVKLVRSVIWATTLLLVIGCGVAIILMVISHAGSLKLATTSSSSSSSSSSNSTSSTSTSASMDASWKQFACQCPISPTPSPFSYSPSVYPTIMPSSAPTTHAPTTYSPSVVPTTHAPITLSPSFVPTKLSPTVVPTTHSPTSPTAPPLTHRPVTSAPTASTEYNFQCSATADKNGCPVDCGVCGTEYYVPFVIFALITAASLALVLFLVFVEIFCFPLFPPPVAVIAVAAKLDPHSAVDVTVHGSMLHGYPVTTRLRLADALAFERHLMDKIAGIQMLPAAVPIEAKAYSIKETSSLFKFKNN